MPSRIKRLLPVLVAAAVAFAAPWPILTPQAAAADPGNPVIGDYYLNQAVSWVPCPDSDGTEWDSECASVRVPRDWRHQQPGTSTDITLAISYLKSDQPTSKGLLASNPGGPGVPGLHFTELLSRSKPEMVQYDLLGFDPRGYGRSTPIQCVASSAALKKLPQVADRRKRDRATHRVEVAEAKLFGQACASNSLAKYVNTQQTVWDLEFLRQFLARNKSASYPTLNYIGYSYGTWLGAWYADSYPALVGKFVLDSNMQWTASMDTNNALDPMSFQRRRDKMLFPYLARHNSDFGLGKSAKTVKKRYESIRKKLAKKAKSDLKKHKTPKFGPEDFDFTVSTLIYLDEDFPAAGDLIYAVKKYAAKSSSKARQRTLARHTKALLANAPFVIQRNAQKTRRDGMVAVSGLSSQIVRCNDSLSPSDPTWLLRRADRAAKKYPFAGYMDAVPMCAYWHYKQTRAIDLTGAPRMLMFQSEGDPATAYEGARASHRRVPTKTVLVSVNDEGQHGLYIGGPSRCLETVGDAYLFGSGALPSRDTVCGTSPLPFDSKVYALSGPVSSGSVAAAKKTKAPDQDLHQVRVEVAKRTLG